MLDFSSNARRTSPEADRRRESYALYVVDADLGVVLSGTDPADLAPASVPQTLPSDLSGSLAVVLHEHNFDRETIARIAISDGRRVRATRLSSLDRPYYAVMVEKRDELPV